MKNATLGNLSKIFGKKKTAQAPKETPKDPIVNEVEENVRKYYETLLKTAEESLAATMVSGSGCSGGSTGPNNAYIGTITAPNTGGQYSPIVAPQPGLGGITPNQWVYKTWLPGSGLERFPEGVVRSRVEEYLDKRSHEVMRGRFEKDFLHNVLGLTLEEMKDRWYILKDGEEMTDDLTLCSNIKGKPLPLLHQCKEGGKFYSKTETNMTRDKIWCQHCEEDLPEDLETMLVISHVM